MTFLLVEDDEISQMVTSSILQSQGALLSISASGREAVEKSRAITYDVILLDLGLPDMSGYEAARLIRQQERGCGQKPARIFALSAAEGEGEEALRQAGIDGILLKPLDAVWLASRLCPEPATRPEAGCGCDGMD